MICAARRVPDVLQHHAGAQHGHHQPVHEAGLVGHGRGHQHHVVGAQVQALGIGNDVGQVVLALCITPLGSPVVPEV
jgi:hypothetical protein